MKKNLVKNTSVYFEEITHSYIREKTGDFLIGVTSLMKKHGLSPDYSNIPVSILEQAAKRGTAIHKAIENYCNGVKEPLTEEVKAFKKLKLKVIASEYLVSDNETVATSIDHVLNDYSLIDVKTTSVLHKEPLSWQLSIGAYLFELQNPGLTVPALYGLHIHNKKANLVEVPRKPVEEVRRLIECEKAGEIFISQQGSITKIDPNLCQIYNLENFIIDIETQAKEAKAKKDLLVSKLYKEMEDRNIKQIDNDLMTITRVLPTSRSGIDSTKLKRDFPEIYAKVLKESIIKGSIRLTLKNNDK